MTKEFRDVLDLAVKADLSDRDLDAFIHDLYFYISFVRRLRRLSGCLDYVDKLSLYDLARECRRRLCLVLDSYDKSYVKLLDDILCDIDNFLSKILCE